MWKPREAVTEWKDWRDIFKSEARRTPTANDKIPAARVWRAKGLGDKRSTPMELSTACTLDARQVDGNAYVFLTVQPTEQAIEAVHKNTIHVSYDSMSWRVIVWDDGRALVTCSHSSIIADVWVAKIDASTIPAEFLAPDEEG